MEIISAEEINNSVTPGLRIIPNILDERVTKEVNRFLSLHPQYEEDRGYLVQTLLNAFDRYGEIATISLPGCEEDTIQK